MARVLVVALELGVYGCVQDLGEDGHASSPRDATSRCTFRAKRVGSGRYEAAVNLVGSAIGRHGVRKLAACGVAGRRTFDFGERIGEHADVELCDE